MGAKGLARAKVGDDGDWTQSPLAKTDHARAARGDQRRRRGAKAGDLICLPVRQASRWCTR